jgi:hypothetical protein
MKLQDRIIAFSTLGKQLFEWIETKERNEPSAIDEVVESAFYKNGWFDESQVMFALKEVGSWLNETDLNDWASPYNFDGTASRKKVGVIMAGNIPLVGYHDYLSVLISGNKLLAKLSSKDEVLIRFLHAQLIQIQPKFQDSVDFSTERFTEIDAVIATGSNNSSRYFDYYFSKIPNIIRKNRTSVAIVTGNETKEELASLGNDIFRYYGLGCRNITKVYFPKDFDINWFYEGILPHSDIINNHKYQNNYDYHKSLFLLNRDKLWDNNFLLLKKDKSLSSPVGTLFYEEYEDLEAVHNELIAQEDQIQCKVGVGGYNLGQAQKPRLTDYSDNINVLEFLLGLE